MIAVLCHSL